MTYRVLVTGSTKWTDRTTIRHALFKAWREVGYPEDMVLVHGAAKGADTLAAQLADRLGWVVEPYPADWENKHKAAGPIRNAEMVKLGADVCLAFPLPGGKGTQDCMKKAAKAGIPVVVHPPSDL